MNKITLQLDLSPELPNVYGIYGSCLVASNNFFYQCQKKINCKHIYGPLMDNFNYPSPDGICAFFAPHHFIDSLKSRHKSGLAKNRINLFAISL